MLGQHSMATVSSIDDLMQLSEDSDDSTAPSDESVSPSNKLEIVDSAHRLKHFDKHSDSFPTNAVSTAAPHLAHLAASTNQSKPAPKSHDAQLLRASRSGVDDDMSDRVHIGKDVYAYYERPMQTRKHANMQTCKHANWTCTNHAVHNAADRTLYFRI